MLSSHVRALRIPFLVSAFHRLVKPANQIFATGLKVLPGYFRSYSTNDAISPIRSGIRADAIALSSAISAQGLDTQNHYDITSVNIQHADFWSHTTIHVIFNVRLDINVVTMALALIGFVSSSVIIITSYFCKRLYRRKVAPSCIRPLTPTHLFASQMLDSCL